MRSLVAVCLASSVSGCATFPEAPSGQKDALGSVVSAIRCELAAAARSEIGVKKKLSEWNAAAELLLTLDLSSGGEASAGVIIPTALGATTAGLAVAGARADRRSNEIKFGVSMANAVVSADEYCVGDNPSETNMGLALWLTDSLAIVPPSDIVSMSLTKQFILKVTAGARFGYVMIPVANPVTAAANYGGERSDTNRFTVSLTPFSKPKPLKVSVTNWPSRLADAPKAPVAAPAGKSLHSLKESESADGVKADRRLENAQRKRVPRSQPSTAPQLRDRVIQDPVLMDSLRQRSPVYLAQ